jgi:hypothetical protein
MDLTAFPCICEGRWFASRGEASLYYGYKSKDGLKYKLNNPDELDFIWLKDTKMKPILEDEEIQKLYQEWLRTFKPGVKRVITRED